MIMRTNNCLIVEEEALQIFSFGRVRRREVWCVFSFLPASCWCVCLCFSFCLSVSQSLVNFFQTVSDYQTTGSEEACRMFVCFGIHVNMICLSGTNLLPPTIRKIFNYGTFGQRNLFKVTAVTLSVIITK